MAKKTIKSLLSKVKGTRYTFYNLDNSAKSRFRNQYKRVKNIADKGYYIESAWVKRFNDTLKQKRKIGGKSYLEMEYLRKMKAMDILMTFAKRKK